MFKLVNKLFILCGVIILLASCAHNPLNNSLKSIRIESDVQQGKRYFEQGYYKSAMKRLLPPACDGNAQAQYAVGYMYYYGYGVAQDTDVGLFWIERSASQGYKPAELALDVINKESAKASSRRSPYDKISPHYN
jgi:TPR repeat protein